MIQGHVDQIIVLLIVPNRKEEKLLNLRADRTADKLVGQEEKWIIISPSNRKLMKLKQESRKLTLFSFKPHYGFLSSL